MSLTLDTLHIRTADGQALVDGVSLRAEQGRCLVILGESGSGKSLTSLALMRILPEGLQIHAGQAHLDGDDLFALPEQAMQQVRGARVAMIFQEPMTSLNPVMTVAAQIAEGLVAGETVEDLLTAVGLDVSLAGRYPFQLSGGQRQRALIAVMLAGQPDWLIADEPTTALDVTTQAQILQLIKRLQVARGMGLILITHDIDIAREMAAGAGDQVAVMYAGQIVEQGPATQALTHPGHPYTQALLRVLPSVAVRGQRLAAIQGAAACAAEAGVGCRFAPRCAYAKEVCRLTPPAWQGRDGQQVRCVVAWPDAGHDHRAQQTVSAWGTPVLTSHTLLTIDDLAVHFPIRKGLLQRTVGWHKAVDGVSLTLARGETLALVGESGCGKSTLARAVLNLLPVTAGQVALDGQRVDGLTGAALLAFRRRVQIVFQDPFASLNPRLRIGEILAEGLYALRPDLHVAQHAEYLAALLEQVGLTGDAMTRYPHAFSGGQRQRIAIARALAVEPDVLICDEPTSALDVSVQAQILNLLQDLQQARGLAYLFISHNLPVVGYLADRVAVMQTGQIVEEGAAETVLTAPSHPYTQALLEAAPGRKV